MPNSNPIIIICAGLNRSGSTWQTNAVRLLLQHKFSAEKIYPVWIDNYDRANATPVHLVKLHRYNDAHGIVAHKIFSTFRDLRAVAGSLIRMGWSTMEWQDLQYHLDHYVEDSLLWQSKADLITPYEDILNFPLQVVSNLSKFLEISLSRPQLTALLKRLDTLTPAKLVPDSHLNSVDQTTFLHNGHIGDKSNIQASSRLPPKIKSQIEDRYHAWLCAHGYSLG